MTHVASPIHVALLLPVLLAGACVGQPIDAPPRSLDDGIELAAGYLTRACSTDGRFAYRVDTRRRRLLSGYNELRHAGTIYAMAMAYARKPDPALREAILRAAGYMRTQMIRPVQVEASPVEAPHGDAGLHPMLAVWSPRTTGAAGDGAPVQFEAKLGGAGLALVALAHVERMEPGSIPIEELRGLGRFILYMQKPTGAFHSKYIPAEGGLWDAWDSLYYPGEAALGLVMLHELDRQPAWVQGASDAIGYLARRRREEKQAPPDHWALLATARLLSVLDDAPQPTPRPLLIEHALQISRTMLSRIPQAPADRQLAGCMTADGRTTPTATRVEGLIAALSFIPESRAHERRQIREAVDAAVDFLLRAQIIEGSFAGALPGAAMALPRHHPAYSRSANQGVHEVRIDYVQHALSAFIQYDALGRAD